MKGGSGPLFVLAPHQPDPAVRSVSVTARRAGSALNLLYAMEGDLRRIRLQAEGGELWQHTCFEAFLAAAGMPSYVEYNFSLARAWKAYRFSSYRKGAPLDDPSLAPSLHVRLGDERVELEADIDLGKLGLEKSGRMGLSAVIEGREGGLSYWALRHALGKPDFHHPDAFVLDLDALRH
jgi:hypothetical protein